MENPNCLISVNYLQRTKGNNNSPVSTFFYVSSTNHNFLNDAISEISPRLSTIYAKSTITIRRNNDPFGVLSIIYSTGESDGKSSEPGSVEITIFRTGMITLITDYQ